MPNRLKTEKEAWKMSEHDKFSWTVYEPAICECIGVKIAWININGTKMPTVILDLVDINNEKEIVRWLNLKKTSKSISALHNGDFAKLFRLTTGENPIPRYNKPHQLMTRFVGQLFMVEYKDDVHSDGTRYLKSTTISPVNRIVTDDWLSSGALKGKQRGRYKPNRSDDDSKRKEIGNDLEKNRKKSGNSLERQNQGNASDSMASTDISNPLKRIETKVEPYTRAPSLSTVTDQYETIVIEKENAKISKHYQRPHESDDDYFDRVFDETGFSDQDIFG